MVAGDTAAVLALYHKDLTLDWPGRHRLAGTHVGQDASIEALLGLQAATNRLPVKVVDVMAGQNGIAVKVLERWSRLGTAGQPEVLEHTRVLEYTVEDNQLRTCAVYESAQGDIDDWLACPRSEADGLDRRSSPACERGRLRASMSMVLLGPVEHLESHPVRVDEGQAHPVPLGQDLPVSNLECVEPSPPLLEFTGR